MSNLRSDELLSRSEVLQHAFFRDRDRQLAKDLRSTLSQFDACGLLADALGISRSVAEEQLAQLGCGLEVVPAMALLPLAEVAWCDGEVSGLEKAAVLRAAAELGIVVDSPMYVYLQNWLDARPSRAALDAWRAYVKSFLATVDPALAMQIQEGILGRAERIAAAAGGYLGISTISAKERACLDELATAFS